MVKFTTGNEELSSSSDNEKMEAGSQKSSPDLSETKELFSILTSSAESTKPTTSPKSKLPKLSKSDSSIEEMAKKLVREKFSASPIVTKSTSLLEPDIGELLRQRAEIDGDIEKVKARYEEDRIRAQFDYDKSIARMKQDAEEIIEREREALLKIDRSTELTSKLVSLSGLASIEVDHDHESVEPIVDLLLESEVNVLMTVNRRIEIDLKILSIDTRSLLVTLCVITGSIIRTKVGEYRFNEGAFSARANWKRTKEDLIEDALSAMTNS